MKKTAIFVLAVASLLAFAACDHKTSDDIKIRRNDTSKTEATDPIETTNMTDDPYFEPGVTDAPPAEETPTPTPTPTPEPEATSTPTPTPEPTSETEADPTSTPAPTEDGIDPVFQKVLDECLYHVVGNLYEEDDYMSVGIDEQRIMKEYSDLAVNIRYAFRDINDDGVDELLILSKSPYYENDFNTLAVYMKDGDEAKLLIEGFERSQLYLLKNNTFINMGSAGAAYSITGIYSFDSKGKQNIEGLYFTDFENYDSDGNPDTSSDICWFQSFDGVTGTRYSTDYKKIDGDLELVTPDDYYIFTDKTTTPIGEMDHHYEFVHENVTYDEAKAACEAKGGHLLTINSDQEYMTVIGLMGFNYCDNFMLFTSAECKDGEFVFEDGTKIPDGYWGMYEPAKTDKDAVTFFGISGEDGSGHLYAVGRDPISSDSYYTDFIGYICEYDY